MQIGLGFGREGGRMKERLTKNLGLKMISLFCAFFVWLSVVNVANPVKIDTKEVPVEVTNSEILERSNLTYEIIGKKTAVISYKVKAKDAYKVKAADFRAYADLSEMYDVTGAIPIKVEVLKNDELLQSNPTVKTPEVIKIKTEELQTKRFALKANPYGTPTEGYVTGNISMAPDFIYVKGPVSQIGQINSAGIEFNIEGAVSDVSGTEQPVFYDANGNSLDLGDTVKALTGDITYSMQIFKIKNVPLDFVVTGEVKQGYKFTGVECSVKSLPVAGLKSVLDEIKTITVQSPELNIEGATEDKVCEIDLAQYIGSNIQIANMNQTKVKVTLKVEPLEERIYTVYPKDIVLSGKQDAYEYSITNDKIEVKIRGLKEDLNNLSTSKMNLTLDVSSMSAPGNYEAKAALQLDKIYEIKQYPECHISVSEKKDSDASKQTESSPVQETKETKTDKTEGKNTGKGSTDKNAAKASSDASAE